MLVSKCLMVGVVASLACMSAQAQTQTSGLEVTLGLAAEHNSNPDNLIDNAAAESELEYAGILGVRGELAGPYAKWSSDLNYEVRRFSENEESDYELALGQAELTLGNDRSRLFSEFNYVAEEELIDLRVGRTPENLDFRAVSAARVSLRSSNPVNRFAVFANAANVEYETSRDLESSQLGGGLRYQRAPSPTSQVALEASGYSLDYKHNEAASFDYYLVTTSWQQVLRKAQYQVVVGANRIEKEEKSTSPYYQLSAEWREPTNRYSVSFQQFLTDTSRGAGGGGAGAGEVVDPVDGRLEVVDQYRFQEAQLSWRNSSVCQRCDSTVRVLWQREDYQTFEEENNTQRVLGADFRYQPRRRMALSASAQLTDLQAASPLSRFGDFQEQRYRLTASWSELARRGRLELYVQTLEREFDNGDAFDQDLVGLRFDWLLYER